MTRIVAVTALAALLAAVLLGGTPTNGSAATYRRFFELGERACAQGPVNIIGAADITAAVQVASNPLRYPPGAHSAFRAGCRAANLDQ